MAIQKLLLDILCCPETKAQLILIDNNLLMKINAAIKKGGVHFRNGKLVAEPIDEGLLRADGKYLYLIRNEIPVMLIDEAIDMSTIE